MTGFFAGDFFLLIGIRVVFLQEKKYCGRTPSNKAVQKKMKEKISHGHLGGLIFCETIIISHFLKADPNCLRVKIATKNKNDHI